MHVNQLSSSLHSLFLPRVTGAKFPGQQPVRGNQPGASVQRATAVEDAVYLSEKAVAAARDVQQVLRAALSPADPSGADRAVASQAAHEVARAQQERVKNKEGEPPHAQNSTATPAGEAAAADTVSSTAPLAEDLRSVPVEVDRDPGIHTASGTAVGNHGLKTPGTPGVSGNHRSQLLTKATFALTASSSCPGGQLDILA